MARKGIVEEIFSKALYHDRPDRYSVGYSDFDTIKEVPLTEFLNLSENFQAIPATRIMHIKKEGVMLYSRRRSRTGKGQEKGRRLLD